MAAEPVPAVRAHRIVLTWDDGDPDTPGWVVTVPALPGCVTQGDTEAEALARVQEAISAYLASLARHGEPIPPPDADGPIVPVAEPTAHQPAASMHGP